MNKEVNKGNKGNESKKKKKWEMRIGVRKHKRENENKKDNWHAAHDVRKLVQEIKLMKVEGKKKWEMRIGER